MFDWDDWLALAMVLPGSESELEVAGELGPRVSKVVEERKKCGGRRERMEKGREQTSNWG